MIPVSPLAKAQNLDDVNNMVQFFQITQELGPGGQASVKPEKVAAYIAEKMNIPADILTTEEEQQQIAQQSQQMVQQMMEQQQGAAGPQGQPPEQGMLPEAEMPEGAVEAMKA